MDIWLDTANINTIKKAKSLGILAGVTTNPTIIHQSKRPVKELIKDLLHHQEGPVAVQVVGNETIEMVQEGQSLYAISNRLIIKVPVTKNGFEAIHLLSRQGIPTMATVVFHPHQALMAALAGARFVAPYINRIEQAGQNPWSVLQSLEKMFQNYRLKIKILGASINSVDQVVRCAEMGIYGVTLKDEIYDLLTNDSPLTLENTKKFALDWHEVKKALLI